MKDEHKKLFAEPTPTVTEVEDVNQDRARGELKDLLALENGLTGNEIEWIIKFAAKSWLSAREIEIVDEIYLRRL